MRWIIPIHNFYHYWLRCKIRNTAGIQYYYVWHHIHVLPRWYFTLQWRHNEHDGVSNPQPIDCLFRRRSKETSELRVTGLCKGNSPLTGEFLAQRSTNAELLFPFDHVIMIYCIYSYTKCTESDPRPKSVVHNLWAVTQWIISPSECIFGIYIGLLVHYLFSRLKFTFFLWQHRNSSIQGWYCK